MESIQTWFKDDKGYLIIAILFMLGLFLGPGNIGGRSIQHDYPYAYSASDPIIHYAYTIGLEDSGSWNHYAPWMSGGYDDVVAFNPPVLYNLAVIFHDVSGLELYDSIYFLVFIFSILGVCATYMFIRRVDPRLALASLPFSLFIFLGKNEYMYIWGVWPYLLASVFLIAFFYYIKDFWLGTLFLTATALTHTSEYIFACGFVICYVIFHKFKEWKKYVLMVGISLVSSLWYLWIFYNTWMKTTPYTFVVTLAKDYGGIKVVTLFDYGFFFIPVIFGIIISVFYFYNKRQTDDVFLVAFYMLGIGFTNLIGFGLRAFQTRYFWPLYLSVFFGVPFYILIKNKKLLFAIFIILCAGILIFNYQSSTYNGLVEPNWETLNWVEHNTLESDEILYFQSAGFDQKAVLWLAKRKPNLLELEEYVNLNNRTIKVRTLGEGKSNYAFRDGLVFDYHWGDMGDKYFVDICDFDYYVFNYYNIVPQLNELNDLVAMKFLQNNMSLIYKSNYNIILKNSGGDCFE